MEKKWRRATDIEAPVPPFRPSSNFWACPLSDENHGQCLGCLTELRHTERHIKCFSFVDYPLSKAQNGQYIPCALCDGYSTRLSYNPDLLRLLTIIEYWISAIFVQARPSPITGTCKRAGLVFSSLHTQASA